jgi:hypothetical protein
MSMGLSEGQRGKRLVPGAFMIGWLMLSALAATGCKKAAATTPAPVPAVQPPPTATPAPAPPVSNAAADDVPTPPTLADGESLLSTEPSLRDFLGHWIRSIQADAEVGSLDTFYGPQVSFHSGLVTGERIRDLWVEKRARSASLAIDWNRTVLRHEDPMARGTARPCLDLPDATGDILLVRAHAIEVEPLRSPRIGCERLEGIYLIRARQTAAGPRICHETWSLRDGICASCPTASICPNSGVIVAGTIDPTLSPQQARIARDLAACDAYVAEVRRRRAQMYQLQRSGSDRFQEVVERNQAWLAHQETGPFGRAMADLRALMEHWQAQEDNGANTIHSRAQLMREVSTRCQP